MPRWSFCANGISTFFHCDRDVQAQQPESDCINYFFDFQKMPFRNFVEKIKAGEKNYVGALELMGQGASLVKLSNWACCLI